MTEDERTHIITVALVGPLDHAFDSGALSDEEDRKRSWDERPRVEVEATDEETLGSILKRAGNKLGVKRSWDPDGDAPVPAFFGLRNESQEAEERRWGPDVSTTVTVVDEAGLAHWDVRFDSVTLGQLRRSTEANAVPGDPTQLYYAVYPQVGNGVVATWAIVQSGFAIIMAVAQVIATTEDNIGFAQRVVKHVRDRTGRGKDVIEAQSDSWRERNGDHYAVQRMLGRRPWHPADLAGLLGCTEGEAKTVLWALGWAEADSGLWRPGADDAARVIEAAVNDIDFTYSLGHEDFADTFERRIRHLLVTGELPPRPGIDETRHGDGKAIQRLIEAEEAGYDPDNPYQPEEDEEEEDLPLEHLLVRCACGKEECHAVAGFGIANGRLKIGFTEPTDHFVIDAEFMGRIAFQVDAEIDEAKHPEE